MGKTPFIALLLASWIGQGFSTYDKDLIIDVYNTSPSQEKLVLQNPLLVIQIATKNDHKEHRELLYTEDYSLSMKLESSCTLVPNNMVPDKLNLSYDPFFYTLNPLKHSYVTETNFDSPAFHHEKDPNGDNFGLNVKLHLESTSHQLPVFNVDGPSYFLILIEGNKEPLYPKYQKKNSDINLQLMKSVDSKPFAYIYTPLINTPFTHESHSFFLPKTTFRILTNQDDVELVSFDSLSKSDVDVIKLHYLTNKISADRVCIFKNIDKEPKLFTNYERVSLYQIQNPVKEPSSNYTFTIVSNYDVNISNLYDQFLYSPNHFSMELISIPHSDAPATPSFVAHVNEAPIHKIPLQKKNNDATYSPVLLIAANEPPHDAAIEVPVSFQHLSTTKPKEFFAAIQDQQTSLMNSKAMNVDKTTLLVHSNMVQSAPVRALYSFESTKTTSPFMTPHSENISFITQNGNIYLYLPLADEYELAAPTTQDDHNIINKHASFIVTGKLDKPSSKLPLLPAWNNTSNPIFDDKFVLINTEAKEESENFNPVIVYVLSPAMLGSNPIVTQDPEKHTWHIADQLQPIEYAVNMQNKVLMAFQLSNIMDGHHLHSPFFKTTKDTGGWHFLAQTEHPNTMLPFDDSVIALDQIAPAPYKDFLMFAMENLAKDSLEGFLLTDKKKLMSAFQQANNARKINDKLRLTGYQLKHLPKPEDLDTFNFSDEFSKKVKIAAKPDGSGYYFSVELKPYFPERLSHIKQNLYFVIDNNESTDQHLFKAYISAIVQSIPYIHPDDTFNIFVYDGSIKGFQSNTIYSYEQYGNEVTKFLKKSRYNPNGGTQNISRLLEAINEKALCAPEEVHTVILFTNGATLYSSTTKGQQRINEALAAYTKSFSIYPASVSKASNSRSLEKLSEQYRGKLIQSNTLVGLSRFVSKQVKQIQRPVVKNIAITPIVKHKQQIKIFPDTNHFPEMFSQSPLVIYGFTNSIHAFDLFIQGTINHEWMNAKINISIDNAENGGSDLRKKCMALESKYAHLSQL